MSNEHSHVQWTLNYPIYLVKCSWKIWKRLRSEWCLFNLKQLDNNQILTINDKRWAKNSKHEKLNKFPREFSTIFIVNTTHGKLNGNTIIGSDSKSIFHHRFKHWYFVIPVYSVLISVSFVRHLVSMGFSLFSCWCWLLTIHNVTAVLNDNRHETEFLFLSSNRK